MRLPNLLDVMTGLAPTSLRRLSKGTFEARCGRCFRLSGPVVAVGREHAWSQLIKHGWTWAAVPMGDTGHALCMDCFEKYADDRSAWCDARRVGRAPWGVRQSKRFALYAFRRLGRVSAFRPSPHCDEPSSSMSNAVPGHPSGDARRCVTRS
jgi:hypothetical protein